MKTTGSPFLREVVKKNPGYFTVRLTVRVDPPTVPQEGHNFVTSGFDFFHFFSLLEGIILMFWGEIGFGTQFTRIHRNFKKNVSKKMGESEYFSKWLKNVIFCFQYMKYEIYLC